MLAAAMSQLFVEDYFFDESINQLTSLLNALLLKIRLLDFIYIYIYGHLADQSSKLVLNMVENVIMA